MVTPRFCTAQNVREDFAAVAFQRKTLQNSMTFEQQAGLN